MHQIPSVLAKQYPRFVVSPNSNLEVKDEVTQVGDCEDGPWCHEAIHKQEPHTLKGLG